MKTIAEKIIKEAEQKIEPLDREGLVSSLAECSNNFTECLSMLYIYKNQFIENETLFNSLKSIRTDLVNLINATNKTMSLITLNEIK